MPSDILTRPSRRAVVAGAAIAVLSALGSDALAAGYGTPLWSRPTNLSAATSNRSTYQVFDVFSDDNAATWEVEDLSPDAVNLNPNGSAAFYENSGESFVAGSGNVYGLGAPLDVRVHVPGYSPIAGATTSFLVQMETQGTELVRPGDPPSETYDFSRFAINGTPLTSLREFSYSELSRTPFPNSGTSGGYIVEHAFRFNLPTTASGYDFTYKTLDFHVSQAYLSVDTFVRIAGDFNYDGQRNVTDLDLLLRTTAASTVPLFDVNGDNTLDIKHGSASSDADAWVQTLAHTAYGDTNLDGDVDFDDLLSLAKNYQKPLASTSWSIGDFDASGVVNFDDLLTLAKNYGFHSSAASAPSFQADWALAQSLVPEPSLAMIGLIGAIGLRRRVRH